MRWKQDAEDAGEHVGRVAFHEVQSDRKKPIPGNGWSTKGMWKDQNQMLIAKRGKGNKRNVDNQRLKF